MISKTSQGYTIRGVTGVCKTRREAERKAMEHNMMNRYYGKEE